MTRFTAFFAKTGVASVAAVSLFALSGCSMKDHDSELPRFTQLEAFDPHRPSFECKHEASVNPPITPEAEALFQQALVVTSHELWPKDRNYPKAAALYEQAMKLGHWKAQFNLAGAYLKGIGVPQDIEKAIQLTEDLMKKGVPAAWDNMGAYYMGGVGGLKQDATVAYAFWQKAADMGGMAAQTYLGKKLSATHDEPPSFWGNRKIGLKMLECAFAQGSAQAALELGATLDGKDESLDENYDRALKVLHEGVKRGSQDSAGYLSSSFRLGDPIVQSIADVWRADRYHVLADALYTNPDLRFPNLDKVLPLPPARLPMWDGKKESLINAAKAVVPAPETPAKPASNPASQRTGRAHIPEGWTLPEKPQHEVMAQFESTAAPVSGYWLARLMRHTQEHHIAWDEAQVPLRYEAGESFDRSRTGLRDEDGRIQFHYLGQAVPVQHVLPLEHPLVARGIARYSDQPQPPRLCKGHQPCPKNGVWSASVPDDHPMATVFNQWHRQTYVTEGQPFPDPKEQHLDIAARAVTWQWWDQSNDRRGDIVEYIRVDELAASHAAAPADDPAASAASSAAGADTGAAEPERCPLGEVAATGRTCPQTGWWQCAEEAAPVQGGRRQFFHSGDTLPHAVLLGERSVWQKLKGEQPSHKTATVWRLVDYEEQPAPPASAPDVASAPTKEPKADTPPDEQA
jgi:TPR repeat protein